MVWYAIVQLIFHKKKLWIFPTWFVCFCFRSWYIWYGMVAFPRWTNRLVLAGWCMADLRYCELSKKKKVNPKFWSLCDVFQEFSSKHHFIYTLIKSTAQTNILNVIIRSLCSLCLCFFFRSCISSSLKTFQILNKYRSMLYDGRWWWWWWR